MSNETKRDVLELALDDWKRNFISSLPRDGSFEDWSESMSDYSARYAAALPDDLPIIPKDVGAHIKWCKGGIGNVYDAMDYACGDVDSWLHDGCNSDTFSRAWVLGVWRVEETGEIVKLEADK